MSLLLDQIESICQSFNISTSLSLTLISFVFLALLAPFLVFAKKLIVKKPSPYIKTYKPVSHAKANNKNRKYGTWTPEIFEYPPIEEYKNWSITETRPVPYRAFKHTYFITMGIRSMEWDSWIELDNEWLKYHNRKLERISQKGSELYGTLPEAWDGAIELLMEFREYLPRRYPKLFKKTEKGIDNIITGEIFEFVGTPKSEFKQDPSLMAALMTQDDLAIMVESEKGDYYLKGGSIMLAGFWRLKDKLNQPLYAIHTEGEVPKYKEKLMSPMDKFFLRQSPDKPVVRNNYFLQTDDDLAWSKSIGDEDNEIVGWYTADIATDINKIYYRSERQSLRKLPLTGVTVFTIRTYFLPITELCKEPYVPLRLLNGILSWEKDVQDYRGYTKFKDVLLPYLQEKAKEQELMGYTADKEPVTYPF